MKLYKIIKKYGNTFVIILNKEDRKVLRIDAGDHITVDITKIKGGQDV